MTKFDKRNPDVLTVRSMDRLRAVETRSCWYGSLYIALSVFSINFNLFHLCLENPSCRTRYWRILTPCLPLWGRHFCCIFFTILLREGVPYVKVYRYNPKHLCKKLNGYGDNGQRKVCSSGGSTHSTCQLTFLSTSILECGVILREFSSLSL